MDFSFHWTNQKDGKYAIQKRDTGKKGEKDFREAGKEIERKENQTSKTHFFLTIDNGLWDLAKIKNPRSRAPGYLRFLLEIFAYVGEQIPHTPSFPQQSCGVLNRRNFK